MNWFLQTSEDWTCITSHRADPTPISFWYGRRDWKICPTLHFRKSRCFCFKNLTMTSLCEYLVFHLVSRFLTFALLSQWCPSSLVRRCRTLSECSESFNACETWRIFYCYHRISSSTHQGMKKFFQLTTRKDLWKLLF
mgnify:CR=1 FL=1